MAEEILLESGTNELEIVMFRVGNGIYGINVLKVREIINVTEITETPNPHPSVKGMVRVREEVIPVIDLSVVLGASKTETTEKNKLIITEFNQIKVAFEVQEVTRIHRISWEQIEKPNEIQQGPSSIIIGIVKMDNNLSLLLDYEKIVVDVCPETGIQMEQIKNIEEKDRTNKKIMIAEDSPLLRKAIEDTLTEAGYTNLLFFSDGKELWDRLSPIAADDVPNHVDLIITDIEMPRMDGLHLTKKVKDHDDYKHLPVVIFSSLITEGLRHKGEKVGANVQISKPEIVRLIEEIDQLIL